MTKNIRDGGQGSGGPTDGWKRTNDAQSGRELGGPGGENVAYPSGTGRGADLGALASVYPQDLFQGNQINAVGFYIISKKKLGSGESNRGVALSGAGSTKAGVNAKAAADNYLADYFKGDKESASEGNRADADTFGSVATGAFGAAALSVVASGSQIGDAFSTTQKAIGTGIGVGAGVAMINPSTSKLFRSNVGEFTSQGIYLYVPQSIITAYQANYDETELGMAGMLTGGLDFNMAELGEALGSAGRGLIGSAANLPRALGVNADFASALQATSKLADNPYKEQLFRSMGFRKFSFQYIFSPKNADEMTQVEQIIKIFKFHMHPDASPESVFLQYPSEFVIEFLRTEPGKPPPPAEDANDNTEEDGDKEPPTPPANEVVRNPNLPRIANCALTNVKVTYGPDGFFTTFKGSGGKATEITMELQFTELEVLTGEHIKAGF